MDNHFRRSLERLRLTLYTDIIILIYWILIWTDVHACGRATPGTFCPRHFIGKAVSSPAAKFPGSGKSGSRARSKSGREISEFRENFQRQFYTVHRRSLDLTDRFRPEREVFCVMEL